MIEKQYRFATEDDLTLILDFIRQLAEYEDMLDKVVATEELLNEWIFEKKVAEVVKRAEETAPKNRFENRMAFSELDKLAPKFGREPIYTEQFHIIQVLAYKMQEESAKNPIEQSKEELKILLMKVKEE